MTDLKPTVALTSVNSENMSRHQMLDWVNRMVNGQFRKVEELSSGVAYCQMMEMIFPNCINLKRVKMMAKLEHESFHNMKLFQGALTRLKLDKTIPVDRLIKGRFQDNFEFLQWFKKFFDSQAPGMENIKSAANVAQQPKPIKAGGYHAASTAKDECAKENLQAVMEELDQKTQEVMETRDRAYEKLRQIEILLTETIQNNQHVAFCNRICEVLYKLTDDEQQKQEENAEDEEQKEEVQLEQRQEQEDDINMGMY
ncbi:microtubule-associated protein RP/EB family member 2 [Drosophila nasuta]|uniref:microtubule-associated protein RP/EB family member 2 n=1 Tax=Drosophila nasuta TaxID=42062 RepID=UPI00295EACFB|nr:microtubule-associated protein RP/EB family member 2 [Drosophila nasuta]XP_060659414.1 microtubule-associated protein RP/EB family member 2 [Drosophila nasuta]